MKKREIAEYVVEDFKPITLATAFTAIEQCVEEGIRWFDREGGEQGFESFSYNGGPVMTLPDRVDQVIQVLTDRVVSEIFTAQTLLLGVTILDYDIMTLAMKQNHLGDLRSFLASRFRWNWVKPYLHVAGMLTAVNKFMVRYLIKYDWKDADFDYTGRAEKYLITYTRALVKQREGRILRMGQVIGSPIDGDNLVQEAIQELTAVQQDVRDSRPPLPMSRSF